MAEIGAVLLAAGASQRFGRDNKLLAPLGGKRLIRRVAEEVLDSGAQVVVVTGCDHLLVEQSLEGLPLRFAKNSNWRRGMGSSIAVGVKALGSEVLGSFIIPGDMPFLTSALLKYLIAAFKESRAASIVYPTTRAEGQRNPVLWPRRFFPLLASLNGPAGAKQLLASFQRFQRPAPVEDEGVFIDIDLRTDLESARSRWRPLNLDRLRADCSEGNLSHPRRRE